jgi:hypothetical protein
MAELAPLCDPDHVGRVNAALSGPRPSPEIGPVMCGWAPFGCGPSAVARVSETMRFWILFRCA